MQLQLVTPKKQETFTIEWIELQTTTGSIIIQPGHAPLICSLKPASIIRFAAPELITREVIMGFAQVDRSSVMLLLDE